jgi:hypothetical protein
MMRGAFRRYAQRLAAMAILAFVLLVMAEPARAVPSFAAQTGEPCSACHVGGFGPQLTRHYVATATITMLL